MTKMTSILDNPEKSIGFVLHDTARLMRWNFERRAQTIGLTRAQWSVLAYLKRSNGLRQNELAELLEIRPITLVRLLDRLEKNMWIERRDDPNDRRAKQVFLTEKVQPIVNQMHEIALSVRAEALSGLSEPEQEEFLRMLLLLRGNLSNKICKN